MMKNKRNILLIAIILFNLFGFKFIEPYIVEPVRLWIVNSGPMAAVYYFLAGLISVVIAPITLGPIHVILQKGFGFWMSFGLFYGFTTLGQLINFGLAKRFGDHLVNRFFPAIKTNQFYNWLKSNIDRSIPDMMLINVGIGGDFLAYLFGLSKVKFSRFIVVLLVTNVISTLILVSRNIAVGDTFQYGFWLFLSYFVTYIPLLIVFRKDLPQLGQRIQQANNEYEVNKYNYDKAQKAHKDGTMSAQEWDQYKTLSKPKIDNPFVDLFADKEE